MNNYYNKKKEKGKNYKNSKKKINIIKKFFNIIYKNNNINQLKKIFLERGYSYKKIFFKYKLIATLNNIYFQNFSKNEIFYLKKKRYLSIIYNKFFVYPKKLIIPIKNISGLLLTFVVKQIKPKYLFFNKIIKYNKNEILYGYYENIKYIKKSKNIFVVEGFFDIFRLNYIGIKNTVALLGCFISIFQINFLKKLKKNIFFILDNDEAAKNSLINFCKNNYNLCFYKFKIIFVEIKKDPDIFFKKYTKKKFKKYIKNNSISFIDYFYLNFFCFFKNFFFKNFLFIYKKMNKKNKKNFLLKINKNIKIKNIKKKKFFLIFYKKLRKKIKYNNYILYIIKKSLKKKIIFYKILSYFKNYKTRLSKFIKINKKLYKKIFNFYKLLLINNEF
ncbi:toprim domain-containing protein [Candidatus Vidania fulgoroideorum]